MGFAMVRRLLIFISVVSAISTIPAAKAQNFNCSSARPRCQAMIGYAPRNATTMAAILSLFNIRNLRTVLGANNLPLSTSQNYTVPAEEAIRIPFPCICSNGTGMSNGMPRYTVQGGDFLSTIARQLFSGMVTVKKIQEVNNIRDANLIQVGQNLTIPLPCSCDDVNGAKVVHYAHMVQQGTDLGSIAQEFGTDLDTLMRINGITNPQLLQANQPIDVPLRACNTSISNLPDDASRVPNGTYVFTANDCVRCRCFSANNWTLKCEPSQLQPSSRWQTCPTMSCVSPNVPSLGNSTLSGCSRMSCAYAGFSNQTILTTVDMIDGCPESNPNNNAPGVRLSWNLLFISIYTIFVCLCHLQLQVW